MDIFTNFFKFIIYVCGSISLPFIVFLLGNLIFELIKGKRFIKGERVKLKKPSFIKRLYFDFPRRLILDAFNRDPDFFKEYGVHIVAGEQGTGKTITVAYLLNRFQKEYPRLKVKTNFSYIKEDGEIRHWKDVLNSNNGIYGEIDVIDEIQNWFNSLQSKDFPPEMMGEITQQRKQRKVILGTSQVFTRVAKPIREQTYFLYEPHTLFGCLTIVLKFKPIINADAMTDKKKFRGIFFFVHTDELRDSFDTYKKIEKMSEDGFKSEDLQIRGNSQVENFNNDSNRDLIKKRLFK